MIKEIEIIKNKFNLLPHPEGGYYKETYRGQDSCCTGIFYLLGEGQQSKLHKINSDEMWHFYKGDPLILVIVNDSKLTQITLGNDFEAGHECQYVVKAGDWFGAFTPSGSKYSLVGCTVSPGNVSSFASHVFQAFNSRIFNFLL